MERETNAGEMAPQETPPQKATRGGKFLQWLDNFFEIKRRGSSFKTEIFGGLATFLAMAYILTVNPDSILVLSDQKRWASVFIATALGAIVGTLLMAFLAKLPYAQAPGMGLNALVGTMIGTTVYGVQFSFNNAMFIVLISGLVFLAVSMIPAGKDAETGKFISMREKIFDGIPQAVRAAIPVGIGLFIAFIGLQNADIVQANPFTLVQLVDFTNWANPLLVKNAIVCLFGLILIAVLAHYRIKGAVILGILGATVLAMPLGVTNFDILLGSTEHVTWRFWENFQNFFSTGEEGAFGAAFTNFGFPDGSLMTVIMLILTFSMIDMFDTMGTLVGCATKAGLIDEKGKPIGFGKCMYADSIATVAGAVFGTSTVTTFVESGAGVAEGAKTGLTALVVAGLFLLSIFILPVFAFIPSAAAASALIYVGVLMISTVKNIDFADVRTSVPVFLAIAMMALTYSITNGIGLALMSYVIISSICYVIDIIKYSLTKNGNAEKPKWPVSVVTIVITLLFAVYFFVPKIF